MIKMSVSMHALLGIGIILFGSVIDVKQDLFHGDKLMSAGYAKSTVPPVLMLFNARTAQKGSSKMTKATVNRSVVMVTDIF